MLEEVQREEQRRALEELYLVLTTPVVYILVSDKAFFFSCP